MITDKDYFNDVKREYTRIRDNEGGVFVNKQEDLEKAAWIILDIVREQREILRLQKEINESFHERLKRLEKRK